MGAATDIIVRSNNAEWLDTTVQSFGAVVVGAGKRPEPGGTYKVRCLGTNQSQAHARAEMVAWMMREQGYAEVLRIEDVT